MPFRKRQIVFATIKYVQDLWLAGCVVSRCTAIKQVVDHNLIGQNSVLSGNKIVIAVDIKGQYRYKLRIISNLYGNFRCFCFVCLSCHFEELLQTIVRSTVVSFICEHAPGIEYRGQSIYIHFVGFSASKTKGNVEMEK